MRLSPQLLLGGTLAKADRGIATAKTPPGDSDRGRGKAIPSACKAGKVHDDTAGNMQNAPLDGNRTGCSAFND
jgi:hypothetical protein